MAKNGIVCHAGISCMAMRFNPAKATHAMSTQDSRIDRRTRSRPIDALPLRAHDDDHGGYQSRIASVPDSTATALRILRLIAVTATASVTLVLRLVLVR